MRVLFVSAWFPHPPLNGARRRVHQELHTLASQHEVALLSFADRADVDVTAPALRSLCHTVQVLPRPSFDPTSWRSRLAWLAPQPRSLTATFSAPMAEAVRRAVRGCDVAIASQISCAAYAPYFDGVPALCDELELGALHGQLSHPDALQRWRARLMWRKYRYYLRHLLRRFRACTVVSERERTLLAGVVGTALPIYVLPNGVDADAYPHDTTRQPDTLLFTGSLRYAPNHDGMRWFIGAVWPRIRLARPAARLLITGDGTELGLPPAAGIERTGMLDDIRPLLSTATLAIAPIFAGGGTRMKILEAMAAGTPVVASTKGVEGIDAIAGEHLLVADDPGEFAAHIVALLTDTGLRRRLSDAGRELVRSRYDWRTLGPQFEALVTSVARGLSPLP